MLDINDHSRELDGEENEEDHSLLPPIPEEEIIPEREHPIENIVSIDSLKQRAKLVKENEGSDPFLRMLEEKQKSILLSLGISRTSMSDGSSVSYENLSRQMQAYRELKKLQCAMENRLSSQNEMGLKVYRFVAEKNERRWGKC